MKKCPNCSRLVVGHPNKKFCNSRCKDKYWNIMNPRGYGLRNNRLSYEDGVFYGLPDHDQIMFDSTTPHGQWED